MRWLLAAFALALVLTDLFAAEATPSYAATPTVDSGVAVQDVPFVTGDDVLKKRRRRGRNRNKNSGFSTTTNTGGGTVSVAIDTLKDPRRGESGVFVRAVTGIPGLVCRLSVNFQNGTSLTVADTSTDANGNCVSRFNVPDDKNVIGNAQAVVTVFGSGAQVGQGTRAFTVLR